jgi:hypothetical protein
VYQPATDGVAALHDRIMDGVVGQMELLALVGLRPGIDETGGIVRHKIPDKPRLTLPCCVVTTYNLAESMLGGTTGNDHVGYPVSLSFLSRDPFDFTKEGRVLRWRQQVSRTFRVQRLPGVREVWACAIEPGPVFQYEPRVVEYQISAMTLRFTTREPRGFGV